MGAGVRENACDPGTLPTPPPCHVPYPGIIDHQSRLCPRASQWLDTSCRCEQDSKEMACLAALGWDLFGRRPKCRLCSRKGSRPSLSQGLRLPHGQKETRRPGPGCRSSSRQSLLLMERHLSGFESPRPTRRFCRIFCKASFISEPLARTSPTRRERSGERRRRGRWHRCFCLRSFSVADWSSSRRAKTQRVSGTSLLCEEIASATF